jgi:beta-lactamase superfamily II metal-dependent hydrolase
MTSTIPYEVDFLPVGQSKSGDAIALRFGNLTGARSEQRVVVIDGGYTETGKTLVEHIKTYYQTDRVDLVISSHPDFDHSAGLEVVLEQCEVGTLWMHQPWQHTTDIAKAFKDGRITDNSFGESLRKSLENACRLERLATRQGIPIIEPFTGLADESGRVFVVGPTQSYYESLLPGFRCAPEIKSSFGSGMFGQAVRAVQEVVKSIAEAWNIETLDDTGETSAENNSSTIVMVALDEECLLFTADAGMPALSAAADALDAIGFDYNRIKLSQVPHHGSRRNVGPTILNRLFGPPLESASELRSAFVSVAAEGAPKHPSKKVMNAYKRRGVTVHATAGLSKCHRNSLAPLRPNWFASTPVEFFYEVED